MSETPYYVSQAGGVFAVYCSVPYRCVSVVPLSHEDAVVLCERLNLQAERALAV